MEPCAVLPTDCPPGAYRKNAQHQPRTLLEFINSRKAFGLRARAILEHVSSAKSAIEINNGSRAAFPAKPSVLREKTERNSTVRQQT